MFRVFELYDIASQGRKKKLYRNSGLKNLQNVKNRTNSDKLHTMCVKYIEYMAKIRKTVIINVNDQRPIYINTITIIIQA